MSSGFPTASLIGNEEVAGSRPLSTLNPATGQVLAQLSALDGKQVQKAVDVAAQAFPGWAKTSFEVRRRFLFAWLDVLLSQAEELAILIAKETGKPVSEALLVDLLPACEHLAFLAHHLPNLLRPRSTPPEQLLFAHWRAFYRFEPLGVVVIITPWNYPLGIPVIEIAQALAGGNTVVFKPASATALTGLKVGETLRQANLPPGVVNTVVLPGSETALLLQDPRVTKVFFTGSVEAGKKVAQMASARLCPVQLELGGKDAAVVAADADLEHTAHGLVWGAFQNCGQTCASIERVYVERPLFEPLVERVLECTSKLKVQDPLLPDTDLGPMTTPEQRKVVVEQVNKALAQGASALTGGKPPPGPGFYYPPTVLVNLTEDMEVMREETFGPVMPIVRVDSLEEAVERANGSRFGLTASGWTRSRRTAEYLMRALSSGVVTINEHIASFAEPTATWGGLRDSGIGRSHGFFGLLEMVNIKYVSQAGATGLSPWYYPYDEDKGRFLRAALPALYARGRVKWAALVALLRTRTFWARVRKAKLLARLPKIL